MGGELAVSMWRSIATVIGSIFDRPAASLLPYGTQWHDPDTGNTYATDEAHWYPVGTAAGVGQVGPWVGDDIGYDTQYQDLTLLDGIRLALPMCSPVNVECVVVYLSEVIVYGSVQIQLTVNGIDTGDPITLEEGNCLAADLGVYVETCDVIGFSVSTSPDLEPDVSVTVMARLGAPTPPDVTPAEAVHTIISHGIVLGHEVTGSGPPDAPPGAFARYRASELVLSDTDPVSSWADEGSGGNDLLQATGTNQPTYEAAGFNGHPSVLTDGVNHWMRTGVYSAVLAQPSTTVVMGEWVSIPDGSSKTLFDGGSAERNALGYHGGLSGDPWRLNAGSNVSASGSPRSPDLTGVDVCLVVIFNGSSSDFHVNNGADQLSNNPGTDGRSALTIGADFSGSFGRVNFRFVEVLIYDRILDAGEIADLQTYFAAVYS